MSQTAKAQEPSMEEILASIRRIIADDDANKTVPLSAEPAKPVSADVLAWERVGNRRRAADLLDAVR